MDGCTYERTDERMIIILSHSSELPLWLYQTGSTYILALVAFLALPALLALLALLARIKTCYAGLEAGYRGTSDHSVLLLLKFDSLDFDFSSSSRSKFVSKRQKCQDFGPNIRTLKLKVSIKIWVKMSDHQVEMSKTRRRNILGNVKTRVEMQVDPSCVTTRSIIT